MDWIGKAFEKANEESEEMELAHEITGDFMEKDGPKVLEMWANTHSASVVKKVADIMQDEELSEAFFNMCASFFMTGLVNGWHIDDEE